MMKTHPWKNFIKPAIRFIKKHESVEKRVQALEEDRGYNVYIDSKLDAVIQLLDAAFFVCDKNGICILANHRICELFGATEKQMRGYGWLNFLHRDDKDKAQKTLDQAIHNGGDDIKIELRVVHGITEEVIVAIYHVVISRDDEGEVIISVGKADKK